MVLVLRVVTLSGLVGRYQLFGETCVLHGQSWRWVVETKDATEGGLIFSLKETITAAMSIFPAHLSLYYNLYIWNSAVK
jgi:hypothetical protein